jgi:hypothetical protein
MEAKQRIVKSRVKYWIVSERELEDSSLSASVEAEGNDCATMGERWRGCRLFKKEND